MNQSFAKKDLPSLQHSTQSLQPLVSEFVMISASLNIHSYWQVNLELMFWHFLQILQCELENYIGT